jgi:hypothetical protein
LRAGRIVLIIFTGVFVLVAVAFLAAGGFLVWLHVSHGDGQGYLNSMPVDVNSGSRAVISPTLHVSGEAGRALEAVEFAGIRLECTGSPAGRPVFIGIGEEGDVMEYLRGVDLAEVKGLHGLSPDFELRDHPGTSEPPAPGTQDFWLAASEGPGTQEVRWEPGAGDFVVVVMNADASPGIDSEVRVGARISWLVLAAGLVLLLHGSLGLVGAGLLAYFAITGD